MYVCVCVRWHVQGKRTNLRKSGSERIDHSMRVKFNPLALLLDSSLEGEYDLVQRIIYEVRHSGYTCLSSSEISIAVRCIVNLA